MDEFIKLSLISNYNTEKELLLGYLFKIHSMLFRQQILITG